MITKQNIITAVRHIQEQTKTRSRRLMNPVRDWFILLVVAIVVGSVCAIWSISTFQKLQHDEYVPSVSTDRAPVYDRGETMEILEFYMSREARRAKLVPLNNSDPVISSDENEGEEVSDGSASENSDTIISN